MAPSAVNDGARALEGLIARWEKDINGSLEAGGGGSSAYTLTPNRTISSLYDGLVLAFEATAANTATASLNVSSLGAKEIKKAGGASNLAANDIRAGQKVKVVYDASADVFQMVSPIADASDTSGNTTLGNTSQVLIGAASTAGSRLQVIGAAGSTLPFEASFLHFENSTSGPSVFLNKSRSDTIGTKTVVQSGDTLGQILFAGSDGTNWTQAASIIAAVDGTPGASDMPGSLSLRTTLDGASSPTERMKIANDGTISFPSIANAVTTAAAVASTNKIAFVINGTTYYFLVTTVP
jgi:LysM repeat protein